MFVERGIDVTSGATRGGDENKAEAPLFHGRRRGLARAAILDGVLKNDVTLLVDAVEGAQEEPSVFDPHQHSPKQQLPCPTHRAGATGDSCFYFHGNSFFLFHLTSQMYVLDCKPAAPIHHSNLTIKHNYLQLQMELFFKDLEPVSHFIIIN